MQVGTPIHIDNLTAGEKAKLVELGWKEGDLVPGNMSELMANAAEQARDEATDVATMGPPADPTTVPPLVPPEVQELGDLPPEQKAHYTQIMSDMLKQAKELGMFQEETQNLDPSVTDAVRLANQTDIQDDTAESNYSAGNVPKQSAAQEPPQAENPGDAQRCPRCSWPSDQEDPIEVTEIDKGNFLQSVLGMKPFIKIHYAFGERMRVMIRSLTIEEGDLVWAQVMKETNTDKINSGADQIEWMARYRAALQIINIDGSLTHVDLPQDLAGWKDTLRLDDQKLEPLTHIWAAVQKGYAGNESVHRTLTGLVAFHNQLVNKLEANSQSPDFWTTVGG